MGSPASSSQVGRFETEADRGIELGRVRRAGGGAKLGQDAAAVGKHVSCCQRSAKVQKRALSRAGDLPLNSPDREAWYQKGEAAMTNAPAAATPGAIMSGTDTRPVRSKSKREPDLAAIAGISEGDGAILPKAKKKPKWIRNDIPEDAKMLDCGWIAPRCSSAGPRWTPRSTPR